MSNARTFISARIVTGMLIVVPAYLALLLLLQGMKSLGSLVQPVAVLLPGWIPAERLLSLLLVLAVCFLVGVAMRTRGGRMARDRVERSAGRRAAQACTGSRGAGACSGTLTARARGARARIR